MKLKIILIIFLFNISLAYSDEIIDYKNTDTVYCESIIKCGPDYLGIYSYGKENEEKNKYKSLVIAFDKDKNVFDSEMITYMRDDQNYIFTNDKYIILRIHFPNTSTPHFLIFSSETQKISVISSELPWVAQFFVYKNILYYSSYKGAPNINYIDLNTGMRFKYKDFYIPGASFVVEDNEVYAVCNSRYPKTAFLIDEDGIKKVDKSFETNYNNIRLDEYVVEEYIPFEELRYKPSL